MNVESWYVEIVEDEYLVGEDVLDVGDECGQECWLYDVYCLFGLMQYDEEEEWQYIGYKFVEVFFGEWYDFRVLM